MPGRLRRHALFPMAYGCTRRRKRLILKHCLPDPASPPSCSASRAPFAAFCTRAGHSRRHSCPPALVRVRRPCPRPVFAPSGDFLAFLREFLPFFALSADLAYNAGPVRFNKNLNLGHTWWGRRCGGALYVYYPHRAAQAHVQQGLVDWHGSGRGRRLLRNVLVSAVQIGAPLLPWRRHDACARPHPLRRPPARPPAIKALTIAVPAPRPLHGATCPASAVANGGGLYRPNRLCPLEYPA